MEKRTRLSTILGASDVSSDNVLVPGDANSPARNKLCDVTNISSSPVYFGLGFLIS